MKKLFGFAFLGSVLTMTYIVCVLMLMKDVDRSASQATAAENRVGQRQTPSLAGAMLLPYIRR